MRKFMWVAWLFFWPWTLVAGQLATDQLIIKLRTSSKEGLSAVYESRLSQAAGKTLKVHRALGHQRLVLKLPQVSSAADLEDLKKRLLRDPSIESVEPDYLLQAFATPSDTQYTDQWHLFEAAGGVLADEAWDITTGDTSVVIAVVDTGILTHEDLDATRFVSGYDFVSDVSVANDGNERDTDPTDPGDATSDNECASGYPGMNSSWHGLHVTGILGATGDNAQGVAGINWTSKILPVRALGKCGGHLSDVTDAIKWAAGISISGVPDNANPADVINVSLGVNTSCSSVMQEAIDEATAAGSIVVAAAGNSMLNLDLYDAMPVECDNVIRVVSTTKEGARASYSNYGKTMTVAAPGGEDIATGILSTYNDGPTSADSDVYEALVGTSMAAPVVTGAVSLMVSMAPTITFSQVEQILKSTAQTFSSSVYRNCTTATCGGGLLNIEAAVLAAQNMMLAEPAIVDFGSQAVYSLKGKTITLQNLSESQTAQIGSVSLSGDNTFLIKEDSCSNRNLSPNASCKMTIEFTSTDKADYSAKLVIPNNTSSTTLPITVSGQTREPIYPEKFGGCALELAFSGDQNGVQYVAQFRELRDQWKQTVWGRFLVDSYYAWGSDFIKDWLLPHQMGSETFRHVSLFVLDQQKASQELDHSESSRRTLALSQ